jgi:hypothetical protein
MPSSSTIVFSAVAELRLVNLLIESEPEEAG